MRCGYETALKWRNGRCGCGPVDGPGACCWDGIPSVNTAAAGHRHDLLCCEEPGTCRQAGFEPHLLRGIGTRLRSSTQTLQEEAHGTSTNVCCKQRCRSLWQLGVCALCQFLSQGARHGQKHSVASVQRVATCRQGLSTSLPGSAFLKQ